MKSIVLLLFCFVSLGCSAQPDSFRFYKNARTIIEVGQNEKRYYHYAVVSSNTMTFQTYELSDEIAAQNETTDNPRKEKKKDRFIEISAEEARKWLVTDYDEHLVLQNTYKLRNQFPYAVEHRNHGIYRYRTAIALTTNESVETQRERIRVRCEREYDSLVLLHQQYMAVVNNFENGSGELTLDQIKTALSVLPDMDHGGSMYARAILQKVIDTEPLLYFAYLESVEGNRKPYYNQLDRQRFKQLKKVRTNSPIQKEMVKCRNANNFATAGIITLTTIVDVAFVGGIIYLITLL